VYEQADTYDCKAVKCKLPANEDAVNITLSIAPLVDNIGCGGGGVCTKA